MATKTLQLSVLGMTCDNCSRTVERVLASTPGVVHVAVSLPKSSATVEYDVEIVKPEVIANAVRDLGYEVPA